ncbi:hypothetical protein CBR_g30453 [Chara braunii]|uniref:Uncharacterized protein n=1 Tax=Chara braunii TaxID=69332 RepID=A0A388LCS1_CHABU|nr:hypothetical protein CBR_g30453 [Chara braunii]|eukprot:GBG80086.1 hypothetical protein CBR_g30453 [Chara braunii]
MSIDKGVFIWIESDLSDDQDCVIMRATLYASPSFWVLHGIELALGHESLLAKPLRVVEAAAAKWARGRVQKRGEQVVIQVEVKHTKEFALPSASLQVTLPKVLVEERFGGQARVEAAAEAAVKAREWEYARYTCELIYGLYLDQKFLPYSQELRDVAKVVDAYVSSHDPDGEAVDWDEAGTSIMAEKSSFAKILSWRSTCLSKVLLCESVSDSMPPELRALLFQGRNLPAFLRGYHDFGLMKRWDEKAMWSMLPLFVCEELSEEVYTLTLKSQTWDELESSLKLRFSEDGVESQLGEGLERPAGIASTQEELSGIQRHVGMLEERLTRLEEARRGKRKALEGASSGPVGQGEAEAREVHQKLLLHKGTSKGRVRTLERGEGKGVVEVKEERESNMALPVIAPDPKRGFINVETSSAAGRERQRSEWWPEHWARVVCDRWGKIGRTPQGSQEKGVTGGKGKPEPPKLTKAQRKARNRAQGGQGNGKGQGMRQGGATPHELRGKPAQAGPPLTEQALYGSWTPYGKVGPRPIYNPYLSWMQGICLGPQISMMPPRPPAVQIRPTLPMRLLQPPTQRVPQGDTTGAESQGRGAGRGRGDGGRNNKGQGRDRGGTGGHDGHQRNHKGDVGKKKA